MALASLVSTLVWSTMLSTQGEMEGKRERGFVRQNSNEPLCPLVLQITHTHTRARVRTHTHRLPFSWCVPVCLALSSSLKCRWARRFQRHLVTLGVYLPTWRCHPSPPPNTPRYITNPLISKQMTSLTSLWVSPLSLSSLWISLLHALPLQPIHTHLVFHSPPPRPFCQKKKRR